jgi:hypothetical protein
MMRVGEDREAFRVDDGFVGGGPVALNPAAGGATDGPGRLPRPRTSFVGRERELVKARHLLAQNRLLTLRGPGGCGKTRLSIALATRAIDGRQGSRG